MNENEQTDNIRRDQRQQNYNGNKNDKQYNQFQSQNQKYSHDIKNQNQNYNQKKGDYQNNIKNQQKVNQIIKEKQDLRFGEAQYVIDIYFLQNFEQKQSITNILNEDENSILNNNNKNQEQNNFKTQRVTYNNTGKQYATICRMIQKNHSQVFNKLEPQNQQIDNNFISSNQNQGQNIDKEVNNIDINVAQQHYKDIIYQTQIIFKTLKFVCTSPFRKVNMMEAQSAIRSLIPKLLFLLRQIGIDRENLQKLKNEINEQILKEKEQKISEKLDQQQQLYKQDKLLISRLIQKLLENLKMQENLQLKNFLEQLMSFEQGYPQLIIWLSNLNYFDKFCYENLFILTNEFDYFQYVRKTQRQKVDKQQIRAFRFLPILWGVKKLDAGYLNDKFQEYEYITIKDMKNQEPVVYYNQKLRFNSKFETWVEKILQIMEDVRAKRNNILGFYEIDYILNDEIILETNGGYHFVSSTYNGDKRRFINNYKQKIQHLEYLGYDKVIFINYFDWEMYDNKEEKKINYLRNELQRLSQKK
ncbi:hypothetical protein PPERSA_06959 [Pseudocohnilembus persalinus]|uniref:RAP domain-containing protein n=1 Tax=Pseudocohnilembus persalinus TaxID=266149 RepID=A0A0V0QZ62_PSEPJ|nr:hypothetical protein PPERSA_06959 [Pseudocohnilembus persalinus]|eukprot:KRX07344.1 hypothetical protein PPERSA_06959 [Pseudocohnilembus persalinus]